MNGVKQIQDLNMLQVVGINKLSKEIEECRDMPKKYYDELILHRNEETYEVEGIGSNSATGIESPNESMRSLAQKGSERAAAGVGSNKMTSSLTVRSYNSTK